MRCGRLLQLGGEAARGQRRGDPAQRGVGRRARPARRPRSSHAASTPAAGERLGEPPRLGDAEVLEARRAARPRRRRRRARRAPCAARRRASASRCSADEPLGLARARCPASTKRAERRADRRRAPRPSARRRGCAAAAGLLSSCASPAAIVPSEASRSRFCSIAGDAASSPARPARMTRWCTGGLGEREPAEVVGRRSARRGTASRRCMRTPSGPPVSTAIAPIQVGATLAADRLGAVAVDEHGLRRRPRAAAAGPARLAPCSASTLAGLDVARAARPRPTRRAASSSRSSKRSTGRRSATVTASRSCVGQVLVDERDRHRALADRAGHALDRARAHVAGDEHARARSSRAGRGRACSGQPAACASGPARMKPRSSRATTPSSQSVRGDGADEDEARRRRPRAPSRSPSRRSRDRAAARRRPVARDARPCGRRRWRDAACAIGSASRASTLLAGVPLK